MQTPDSTWQHRLAFFDSALFKAVQNQRLFTDSKTFADAKPALPLKEILARYESQCTREGFDLLAFVHDNFTLPADDAPVPATPQTTVSDYIAGMWDILTRKPDTPCEDSLIPLQHAYLVPGGRFREIYYWDSYFSSLGLMADGRSDLVITMLENFLDIQAQAGCIPNGNRIYYHTRSQPPILALLYQLVAPELSETQKQRAIAGMKTEYAFWMAGADTLSDSQKTHRRVVRLDDGSLLNRYYDDTDLPRPESYREDSEEAAGMSDAHARAFYRNLRAACESGWDFSSRWLSDSSALTSIRTTHIVPVDLNVLLYRLEETLAGLCPADEGYGRAAARRKQAINCYLWNEEKGFYFDFDFSHGYQTDIWSLAGCLPLYAGLANDTRAASVAGHLQTSFVKPGGLVTTLNNTAQQWDSPNGWAPLQWFAVSALERYGYATLATDIMQRWNGLLDAYFARHGVMLEKYNVCDMTVKATGGEYEVQLGFGWTNGVYAAFRECLAGKWQADRL
ncbi:trehalase family glycosidase [Alteromonas halophila]|uniref:Trehalase n=1 Tax=Alteromonas halophila TaxID=516698 RepID=A0A918JJW9_9ALTE|nr:trehalase family glycosidase [Alteromonas halophila]GGW83823.1 trehalase [Alteromonas halophila]